MFHSWKISNEKMQWSDNERKRENLLHETKGSWNVSNSIAWENSRHFAMPPLVCPRDDFWETSAEIPYWWCVTTQIWVMLLIAWLCCMEICFNQSETPRSGQWRVLKQYTLSALVSQTWFQGENSDGVAKCRLFSQASFIHHTKISPRVMKTQPSSDTYNRF